MNDNDGDGCAYVLGMFVIALLILAAVFGGRP